MRERSGEASRDSAPLASSSVREPKRTRLPSERLARGWVPAAEVGDGAGPGGVTAGASGAFAGAARGGAGGARQRMEAGLRVEVEEPLSALRTERNDGMSESDDLAAVGEAAAQVGVDAPDQLEGLARRRPARHAALGEVSDQLLVQGPARGARDVGIRRHAIPHAVKVTIGGVGADGLAVCILGIGAKGPGDGGATHDARDASGQEVLGAVMELLGLPCRLGSMCRWLVSLYSWG